MPLPRAPIIHLIFGLEHRDRLNANASAIGEQTGHQRKALTLAAKLTAFIQNEGDATRAGSTGFVKCCPDEEGLQNGGPSLKVFGGRAQVELPGFILRHQIGQRHGKWGRHRPSENIVGQSGHGFGSSPGMPRKPPVESVRTVAISASIFRIFGKRDFNI